MTLEKLGLDRIKNFALEIAVSEHKLANLSYKKYELEKCLKVIDVSQDAVVIAFSKNVGVVNYNIFTFTNTEFTSRYPLIGKHYNYSYQKYIQEFLAKHDQDYTK